MSDHTDTWDVVIIGVGPGEYVAQYAIACSADAASQWTRRMTEPRRSFSAQRRDDDAGSSGERTLQRGEPPT